MKTCIALLVSTLLVVACGAKDEGQDAPTSSPPVKADATPPVVTATWRGEVEEDEIVFSAWEMDCSGCEGSVERRVGKIEGVVHVEADRETAEVIVMLEEDADREAVQKAIVGVLETPEKGKKFKVLRAAP